MGYNNNKGNNCRRYSEESSECIENHNHEFLSSTDYEKDDEGELHNHRIAGVSGPPIKHGKSHIHKINEYTDTFGDYFYAICDTIRPAWYLPGGKHIHLVKGTTTIADGHDHDYYFTTLIEDPTNVPEERKC